MKCVLGDIAEVTMGQSPKSEFFNTEGLGMPFLQGSRTFGRRRPVFDTYTTMPTKVARAGDIIMSVRAPVGDLNLTPVDMCLGRGVCSLRMKNGNQDFLYYLLKFSMPKLLKKESGTVFGSVNRADITGLELNVPDSIGEQRKIARMLAIVDDKIEKNDAINDNLLQQALTLYRRHFPYAITEELPKGWHVGTVDDIVEFHDRKRIPLSGAQRTKMEKRIYPYYGATSIMDYVDEYIFDGTYLLLGEDGTVIDKNGFPILQYVWGKFWVNNHAHVLTGKLGYSIDILYLLFSHTPVKSIVTGAVQPKISQANLRTVQVVIPPQSELGIFDETVRPIFNQIRHNREQNKLLSAMRDVLLPKLMSGEIDVSAVQL